MTKVAISAKIVLVIDVLETILSKMDIVLPRVINTVSQMHVITLIVVMNVNLEQESNQVFVFNVRIQIVYTVV